MRRGTQHSSGGGTVLIVIGGALLAGVAAAAFYWSEDHHAADWAEEPSITSSDSFRAAPRENIPVPPVCGILPAEFEPHEGLLLAWGPTKTFLHPDPALAKIVALARRNIEILFLVPHARAEQMVRDLFAREGVAASAVRFLRMPVAYPWVRDYGPLMVRVSPGGFAVMDVVSQYPEDAIPSLFAERFQFRVIPVPLRIEGGNLLSNGEGLYLSTEVLLYVNAQQGKDKPTVTAALKSYFHAEQVVYLEPLHNERTGHVDLFAAFTAPDTIVVGQCSSRDDAANAAILDRNARRLARIQTAQGVLKVERIPMPKGNEHWGSYTNVLFANGRLLVPTFQDADAKRQDKALALYQRLLPDWQVVGVDCTTLRNGDGGLHCVTKNLPRLRKTESGAEHDKMPSL